MEKARPGVSVTHETRGLANEMAPKETVQKLVMQCLKQFGPMTARECAYRIYKKADRQLTAPRLTELTKKGFVEPIGSKTDTVTRRPVAVYRIREA